MPCLRAWQLPSPCHRTKRTPWKPPLRITTLNPRYTLSRASQSHIPTHRLPTHPPHLLSPIPTMSGCIPFEPVDYRHLRAAPALAILHTSNLVGAPHPRNAFLSQQSTLESRSPTKPPPPTPSSTLWTRHNPVASTLRTICTLHSPASPSSRPSTPQGNPSASSQPDGPQRPIPPQTYTHLPRYARHPPHPPMSRAVRTQPPTRRHPRAAGRSHSIAYPLPMWNSSTKRQRWRCANSSRLFRHLPPRHIHDKLAIYTLWGPDTV